MWRRLETAPRCGERTHDRQKNAAKVFSKSAQHGDGKHRNKSQDKRVFDQGLTPYILNCAKAYATAIACRARHIRLIGILAQFFNL